MFANWLSLALDFGALFGVGFVARMVNDIFNADYDICCGVRTFAAKAGRRALPYSILAVLFAAICNLHLTLGAFLASYATGRVCKSWEQESKVYSYIESVIASGICILALGITDAIWALSYMCAIYWLEDIVEMNKDLESGHKNLANRFGIVFTLFAVLLAFVVSIFFDTTYTTLALTAFSFLAIFFESTTTELVVDG